VSAAASSLAIIEDFYGSNLDEALLRRISETPIDQLLELADRLVRYNRSAEEELFLNRFSPLHQPTSAYKHFSGKEIYVHETAFFRPQKQSITRSVDLKYALLFSPQLMLPDFAIDWAEELVLHYGLWKEGYEHPSSDPTVNAGPELAQFVRPLIRLAPLIRTGAVLLTASPSHLDPIAHDAIRLPLDFRSNLDPSNSRLFWTDPYLAWLVVNEGNLVPKWELEALDLADADAGEVASYLLGRVEDDLIMARRLNELSQSLYGNGISRREVEGAIQLNLLTSLSGLKPIVTSRLANIHLARSSASLIDGPSAPLIGQVDPLTTAANYGLPELSQVSLDDLVRLRMSEDIYEDLRLIVTEVAQQAGSSQTDDYWAYERRVQNIASDLVTPIWERATRRTTKSRQLAFISGFGAGGSVSLFFNGVALLLPPLASDATRAAGTPVANEARNRARNRTLQASKVPELETARSIMMSILPPGIVDTSPDYRP